MQEQAPDFGFWDCSELPQEDEEPVEEEFCMQILGNFVFVGFLGKGAYGLVSKVAFAEIQNSAYAIKVSELKEAVQGLKVGCALNDLLDGGTGIFVRTYGWLLCASVTGNWTQVIKKSAPLNSAMANEDPLAFTLMDYNTNTFSDDDLMLFEDDYLNLMFHILHGLYVARKRLQFSHEDLHGSNIMLVAVKPGKKTTLEIDGKYYSVPFKRFSPRLIDYDLSLVGSREEEITEEDYSDYSEDLFENSISDEESGSPPSSSDLNSLMYAFINKAESSGDVQVASTLRSLKNSRAFQKASQENRFQYDALGKLMMDPIFADLRQPINIGAPIHKCTVCSADATHQWENSRWSFCGEDCASSLSHLAPSLKNKR